MRTSIPDTRVLRGADVYSDHYLGKEKGRQRFDVHELHSEEIRRSYNGIVKNRYEVLGQGHKRPRGRT